MSQDTWNLRASKQHLSEKSYGIQPPPPPKTPFLYDKILITQF